MRCSKLRGRATSICVTNGSLEGIATTGGAAPKGYRSRTSRSSRLSFLTDDPRPHSHDLTMKLYEEAGLDPRVVQVADEKQTIVHLVAAGLGIAIVPRWTARLAVEGVVYVPLVIPKTTQVSQLPLAAVWMRDSRDVLRDA